MGKKRVIKSLEKLDISLKKLLRIQYPDGFENDLIRLTNAKNEPFFVVQLDTEDTLYLVKIAMIKNSDGEYDIDDEVEVSDVVPEAEVEEGFEGLQDQSEIEEE